MKKILHPLTPAEFSPALKALCEEISSDTEPVYVEVHPLEDAPPNECFPLVEQHAATAGGYCVLGWALWEVPGIFVEAEFHSVWRSPAGHLLDIAPKPSPTQRVLFLPDPSRKYEGRQVDNIRRPVNDDPVVQEYLQTFSEQFEFMNRGNRAGLHGEIHLEGDEAREFARLQSRRERLFLQMVHKWPSFESYTPCWCGSGKKVKWCHGLHSLS